MMFLIKKRYSLDKYGLSDLYNRIFVVGNIYQNVFKSNNI